MLSSPRDWMVWLLATSTGASTFRVSSFQRIPTSSPALMNRLIVCWMIAMRSETNSVGFPFAVARSAIAIEISVFPLPQGEDTSTLRWPWRHSAETPVMIPSWYSRGLSRTIIGCPMVRPATGTIVFVLIAGVPVRRFMSVTG